MEVDNHHSVFFFGGGGGRFPQVLKHFRQVHHASDDLWSISLPLTLKCLLFKTAEYSKKLFFRFTISKRFVNKHGHHFDWTLVFYTWDKGLPFQAPLKPTLYKHTHRKWILIGQSLLITIIRTKISLLEEKRVLIWTGLMNKLILEFVTTMKKKKKKPPETSVQYAPGHGAGNGAGHGNQK